MVNESLPSENVLGIVVTPLRHIKAAVFASPTERRIIAEIEAGTIVEVMSIASDYWVCIKLGSNKKGFLLGSTLRPATAEEIAQFQAIEQQPSKTLTHSSGDKIKSLAVGMRTPLVSYSVGTTLVSLGILALIIGSVFGVSAQGDAGALRNIADIFLGGFVLLVVGLVVSFAIFVRNNARR